MAKYSDIIEGLTVFTKYDPVGKFIAEHDEVFAGLGLPPEEISKEDVERLNNADWLWDDGVNAWQRFV